MSRARETGAAHSGPASGARLAQPTRQDPHPITVVGIGASAGGLEACSHFLTALPAIADVAFILVQHLDPNHESLMVGLLAAHTTMAVRQAADGMPIEANNFYIIPPGAYLTVGAGVLHLTPHQTRGARLPIDYLLHSMAEKYGRRAIAVVLSGSGDDGSLGLKSIKSSGGFVIAQDPLEAAYDAMPRSAIGTGLVDIVLSVAEMPAAIIARTQQASDMSIDLSEKNPPTVEMADIIAFLRETTAHDFTLYKGGTLKRRIERRMALASLSPEEMGRYLGILQTSETECDLLAKDLLINVTQFFRDPKVFEVLAENVIPKLIRDHSSDTPLRVWITGCSTGEETYSLAIIFREQILAAGRELKLQIFASDIDAEAIAHAREGLYAAKIAEDVSPARLERFFAQEDDHYRVAADLRATVVFTVQDVLVDPPFSRLDLISCRNLLIYLRPEAQARVISLFHFGLVPGGTLLLGHSETIAENDLRFEVISKDARIYRHVGRSRPGDLGFSLGGGARPLLRPSPSLAVPQQSALAELCRRLVIDCFAPAAILINRRNECLFTVGPTDRYLQVAHGYPTHDLLALALPGLRTKLRSAIQRARQENARILITGGRIIRDGAMLSFGIDARPVLNDGEDLLLVCFIDEPSPLLTRLPLSSETANTPEGERITVLERELDATRLELDGAIRNLELSSEDQRAINEEALSVNEEFQSTNEELTTSKEELQSLNEELTTLNSQLQESLERQRVTANDLQNVLYSTDVATLFLNKNMNIRFFTPASTALFKIIRSDIGRPLADLAALAVDETFKEDAEAVMLTGVPNEREIRAQTGSWYLRRILPYRSNDNDAGGIVITFDDITDRKNISDALEIARRQAQIATIAKSRFLAAASHDLRQPLQTLTLLQGLLAKVVDNERGSKLIERFDDTLGAMSGMLNTLLDINQIETGTVTTDITSFPINDLLSRLRDEFIYMAQAQRIELCVVASSSHVQSDLRLLEQMVRNLLSNALKYTKQGKVLLGCRRRAGLLSIEIWDTGIGIPMSEIQTIFDEYHQLDNPARERHRGLGLGLSIVQNLGKLLAHPIRVLSSPGKGSMFAIDVRREPDAVSQEAGSNGEPADTVDTKRSGGKILVIEDDTEVRDLLDLYLTGQGYKIVTVVDGNDALAAVTNAPPELIIADYNLPNGMNGLQTIVAIRQKWQTPIPAIVLTGDISTITARAISAQNCIQLHKPVKVKALGQAIERLLLPVPITIPQTLAERAIAEAQSSNAIVFVVDDDVNVRNTFRDVLEGDKRTVRTFSSCEEFLQDKLITREGCLVIDAYLAEMSGLELIQHLRKSGNQIPAIMITGRSDVAIAVEAMKVGAMDFIEKPISHGDLLASVTRALDISHDSGNLVMWQSDAAQRIASLTEREHQIMQMVLAGHPSKNIAADLGISQRTVENHRAAVMKKTGSQSLPALARLALAAESNRAVK